MADSAPTFLFEDMGFSWALLIGASFGLQWCVLLWMFMAGI